MVLESPKVGEEYQGKRGDREGKEKWVRKGEEESSLKSMV